MKSVGLVAESNHPSPFPTPNIMISITWSQYVLLEALGAYAPYGDQRKAQRKLRKLRREYLRIPWQQRPHSFKHFLLRKLRQRMKTNPTPEDILHQRGGGSSEPFSVPLKSGGFYKPFDPNPGSISPEDLAWGLAHTYRYGGQHVPGVTVAEHSVLVLEIIKTLWPETPLDTLKAALLHDASEAVLHDIQGPLRPSVFILLPGGGQRRWDDNDLIVSGHIAAQWGVTPEMLLRHEVKAADRLAVSYEVRDSSNIQMEGLPYIPPKASHLGLKGLGPMDAYEAFLGAMRGLGLP